MCDITGVLPSLKNINRTMDYFDAISAGFFCMHSRLILAGTYLLALSANSYSTPK